MKEIKKWKKVFLTDLKTLVFEIKENLQWPCVIILSGQVGAGKTTFSKAFIEKGELDVTSPSYSMINEIGEFVHADFYRVESVDELLYLELPLYMEGKKALIVEWGKDYLGFLKNNVPEDFHFYEILIQSNQVKDERNEFAESRNIFLYQ